MEKIRLPIGTEVSPLSHVPLISKNIKYRKFRKKKEWSPKLIKIESDHFSILHIHL